MKRWQYSVLIFELALVAAILVLPQVALPAFAFHGGNAPVVAHARVCDHTPGIVIAVAPEVQPSEPTAYVNAETPEIAAPAAIQSRLSRLCVLIC